MISPITGDLAKKVVELNSEKIVRLYMDYLKIDVSRFFANAPVVTIFECRQSGYRFYYPKSLMGDDLFYNSLSGVGDYSRGWSFDHQFAFDKIRDGDSVLEIGCGNGQFMKKVLTKTPDVTGIELNTKMVEICKGKGLNVVNELLDVHKINNRGKYDLICAFQVLEHIYDVKQFLEDITTCLKPGGKIILSTPNNDDFYMEYNKYDTMNLPPHHTGLWNKKAYEGVSSYLGLKLIDSQYELPPSFRGIVFQKTAS